MSLLDTKYAREVMVVGPTKPAAFNSAAVNNNCDLCVAFPPYTVPTTKFGSKRLPTGTTLDLAAVALKGNSGTAVGQMVVSWKLTDNDGAGLTVAVNVAMALQPLTVFCAVNV